MAVLVLAAVLGSAAIALVGFALYLAFCAFVIVRTGGTSGLRDVADAIRAFASVGSLSSRGRLGTMSSPAAEPDHISVPKSGLTGSSALMPPMPDPPTRSLAPPPTTAAEQ